MGGDIGIGSERELYKYINHYSVVTKASMVIVLRILTKDQPPPSYLVAYSTMQ